jgi:EAL domain-containing protein (putative c-di-GMP-specific phosphodiesterase class I)
LRETLSEILQGASSPLGRMSARAGLTASKSNGAARTVRPLRSGLVAVKSAMNWEAETAAKSSPKTFLDAREMSYTRGILNVMKLNSLELTEGVLMKHAESTESSLKTLRATGVQLAVDEFGTGYSSLSYLRRFSIDALKIDQSFVRQITTVPNDTSIVTAVISMGRSLKLRVIAEGVETQEEMAFLQAHQCDEAQGYYFSRPVPAAEFAKLLKSGIAEAVLP